jgi:hypothetical protein
MPLIAFSAAVRTQRRKWKKPLLHQTVPSGTTDIGRMAKRTKIMLWIPYDHEVASPKKGRISRNSMHYSCPESVLIEVEKI